MLVTHDSFAISKEVKEAFEQESGPEAPDPAGRATRARCVNTGAPHRGNPQGDVLFGVDNNLLSRGARRRRLRAVRVARARRASTRGYALDPEHRVTPIDHGDVCLNYDKAWFAERGIAPPELARRPDHARATAKLLVVENPATSTPGLAFLLATIARFGEDGWQDYWRELRANDVLVVDGWEEAYTSRFSGAAGSKGKRPIVVSYASSPPAEVIFAEAAPDDGADRSRVERPASARSSSPASCAARATRTARGSSSTSCSRSASRRTCPLRCSCSRCATRRRCRPCSTTSPSCRHEPLELPPAEIEREPRRAGSTSGRTSSCAEPRVWRVAAALRARSAFLALFFVYPLAAILERGLRGGGDGALDVLTDPLHARGRLVHGLAGGSRRPC